MINSYPEAADYLGKKSNRPLTGRATRLIRRDDNTIVVHYQATDVVTYHADGFITLDSGGWQTVTTKARMTEYTRIRLFQSKSIWYVQSTEGWEGPRSLYYDGMRITLDGLPVTPKLPTATETEAKRALDKRVSAYIKGYAAHIVANGLTNPSNGDCFGCLFQANAPTVEQGARCLQNKPTAHGRIEPMGLDHYISHFDENYFVPSLLANAIRAAGYRDPGFIWQLIQARKDGDMASRILRGYFRNMKPALLKEVTR